MDMSDDGLYVCKSKVSGFQDGKTRHSKLRHRKQNEKSWTILEGKEGKKLKQKKYWKVYSWSLSGAKKKNKN